MIGGGGNEDAGGMPDELGEMNKTESRIGGGSKRVRQYYVDAVVPWVHYHLINRMEVVVVEEGGEE